MLVEPPKGVKPVGCKWVYKLKLGAKGKVTTFKARLVAKGYTQRPWVDFEETYSPVAIANSIWIMPDIAAWYDYEIWQMDVKIVFLNGFIEENIYMDQPEGFHICRRKAEGLPLLEVHLWSVGAQFVFLVLYMDDILLIGNNVKMLTNDVKMLGDTKAWLSTQFSMKNLGEASYILGIKIIRDRSKRMLGMTQTSYVEKVLKRFKMKNSKRGFLPMRHGVKLSKKQSPKSYEELRKMFDIPYASAVGNIQYVVQCTRPNIAFALSVTSRYQTCVGKAHWTAVKTILKYLRRTKDMFLDTTADSTNEAEYIAASEAAKEAVWMKNYIQDLGVVLRIAKPVVIFCNNNRVIAQVNESRSHHRTKHILKCYHLLREMVGRGDVRMDRVTLAKTIANPLTKPVSQIAHAQHLGKVGLRIMSDWL
ncbi:UNVERIFIED_CONTAM: Retrovirus-related Pol polyprotein from transposon TNT 1-94 [Sesamum indicum]